MREPNLYMCTLRYTCTCNKCTLHLHADVFQQPSSPPRLVVVEPYKEKEEDKDGTFRRQYAKRGMRFKHKSINQQSRTESQSTQPDTISVLGSSSNVMSMTESHSRTGSRSQSCNETSTTKAKHRQVKYVKKERK